MLFRRENVAIRGFDLHKVVGTSPLRREIDPSVFICGILQDKDIFVIIDGKLCTGKSCSIRTVLADDDCTDRRIGDHSRSGNGEILVYVESIEFFIQVISIRGLDLLQGEGLADHITREEIDPSEPVRDLAEKQGLAILGIDTKLCTGKGFARHRVYLPNDRRTRSDIQEVRISLDGAIFQHGEVEHILIADVSLRSFQFHVGIGVSRISSKQDIAILTSSKFEKIGDMLCTAPTDEQLRLLKALQMRGDVDSVEVHHILPIFFENYQSMRVLQAISEQNGIKLHLPVQLDCREMFDTLNEASNYLLAACNEFSKKWDNMDIRFHAFYTVNEDEKDKQYDPVYQRYIDLFDNTPQLQEVTAEKQRLSKGELARINWYMRDVKGLDISNPADCITIIEKINDVVKEHPDMVNLFKLSEYKDLLGDEKPPVKDKPTE